MSDDRVTAPAFCWSKYATRFGWRGTMLFESSKRAQHGQWSVAQETITVDGEGE